MHGKKILLQQKKKMNLQFSYLYQNQYRRGIFILLENNIMQTTLCVLYKESKRVSHQRTLIDW